MKDDYEVVLSEQAQDAMIDMSPEDREQMHAIMAAMARNPYLGRPLRDEGEPLLHYLGRRLANWGRCWKRRWYLWTRKEVVK